MARITNESNFVDKKILYNWKINNFHQSKFNMFGTAGKIRSSTFIFEGREYHLEIKAEMGSEGPASKYVIYVKRNCKLNEEFFDIVTILVEGYIYKTIHLTGHMILDNDTCRTPHLEITLPNECSYKMKHENCVTIRCDITSRCLSCSISMEREAGENLEKLSRDLQTLLSTASLSDLDLEVGNRKIAVHSSILSARSPVFAAMLKSGMLETRSRNVTIPDFTFAAVTNMLEYIYSGKLDLKDISSCLLSEMYAVADKYALLDLKEMCRQSMMSDLKQGSVDDYLLKAVQHNDQGMLKFIGDFLANNPQIIRTMKQKELVKEIPDFLDLMLRAFV